MTKSLPKYDTSCNGVTDAADIDVGNTFTTDISGSSVGKYGSLTITSSTLTAWRYDLSSNSYNYKMLPVDVTDTEIFNITVTDSSGASVTRSLTITVTGISNPQVQTQLSGKIVDGYIKYGTINVRDLSNNVIAGPAQTDSLGNYSIDIPVSIPPISYIIECIGGTDIATNLPLKFPLKTIYTPVVNPSADFTVINSSNVCLTPLTTIVTNIVTSTVNGSSSASEISNAITIATNKVATALDISANVVNTDYIAINTPTITNIKVAAAAVKIATITDIISTTESKVAANVLSSISTIIQGASTKITIDNAFVTTAGGQTPITNLTLLVTDVVTRIDAATTLDTIYKTSIGGTTVAASPITSYTTSTLTSSISSATVGVISNICFKAGTKIVTDQGIVNIERITEQNSIRGKKVLLVSQTTNIDDYMVKIEKGALYENVPNADTWLTGEHKVFFNKEMIKSKSLVNGQTIVRENKISEVVYNILLEGENSGKMIANGMISETLSPKSVMVQLLVKLNKLSDKDRERDIIRINKLMTEEKERMKSGASRRP
jgi:VCBS repeat-containing protein